MPRRKQPKTYDEALAEADALEARAREMLESAEKARRAAKSREATRQAKRDAVLGNRLLGRMRRLLPGASDDELLRAFDGVAGLAVPRDDVFAWGWPLRDENVFSRALDEDRRRRSELAQRDEERGPGVGE